MATLANDLPDLLRPRAVEGWRSGMLLALAAHGLLLLALMFSVQWRTRTPDAVEAEMWAEIPRVATTVAVAPAPEPPPVAERPLEPPPPAPVPEPPPPPAEAVVRSQAPKPVQSRPPREVFEPDTPLIKQRLEQVRPKPKPEPPPEPPKPVVPPPKPTPPPPPPPKPAPAPAPVPTPSVPTPAPVPAPKVPPAQPSKAQSKQDLERTRQENLRRMMATLAEDRLQSAGPTAEYAGRIKARVRPNIVLAADIPGNPVATVEVRCAPDGRIIGRKLIIPSGVPAWDDAVLRAIDRTELLPLNEQGRVPTPLLLELRPKDF